MVIIDGSSVYYVYAVYLKENSKYSYFCTNKGGFSFNDDLKIKSDFISKNFTRDKNNNICLTEHSKITGDYLYWEISSDFENNEEKKEFEKLDKEVKKILPEVFEKVEIDYIKWKIKNNELEEWQNNFKDNIYPISNEEVFIDDEKYEIFYNPNNFEDIRITKK